MGSRREAPRLCPACGVPVWRGSWQAALLAASILSSCFLLNQAQSGSQTEISVTWKPLEPIQGQNVTLTPGGGMENIVFCNWYRATTTDLAKRIFVYYLPPSPLGQINGAAYTGRETVGPDCSLHIRNLTSADTGNYTVTKEGAAIMIGHANIVVSEILPKPIASVFPSHFLMENSDSAKLTCGTTDKPVDISWFLNGEPLHSSSHIQLLDNNRTLFIQDIDHNDAGQYQCQVSNPASNESSDILKLIVFYGPDTPAIQPLTNFYSEHSDINLSCNAVSFPEANYTWSVNGTEHNEGPHLLIQDITLEQAGDYTCQATNPVTDVVGNATLKIEVVDGIRNVTIIGPSQAIENNPVTLHCTSFGFRVSYYWFRGGQLIEAGGNTFLDDNNQTLTLNTTTRNDAGNYTCYGNNSFSSNFSEPHRLEIFYGPDEPVIEPQESVYEEHTALNLSCFADSNPSANYSWWYNEEPLEHQNTSQLLIEALSLNDAGTYTCQATNNDTGLSNNTHLEISILESVTNIAIWGPSTTFENNITVLYCNSSGSNVSYYWLKGDQSLEVGEHISLNNNNQTLTLNTTRRNDSGDYTCYGNNSFSSGNTTHSLTVFYGPDVPVISPNTQYYGTGSNLTLSCEADSLPPAQYTWNETKAGNTFQLSNLSLDDSGNYTCKAYNNETDSAQSASLEIWVLEILSKPILTPDKNRTVENETVILQCKTSSNPKVNVSWFKDGKPVPDTAELSDMNRTLTLLNITKDDAGDYTCVASNPVSSESSNPANIVVAYGPYDVHLNQPGTLTVNLGSNLDLLCIADSFPLHFQWFFNNTDQKVANDTFSVPLTAWEDQGNYTCQAYNSDTNRAGSASVIVKLTENTPGTNNGLSGGAIAGIVIGCVAGVVLISGLVYFLCAKTSLGRTEQHVSNGNIPSAPGHNQGVTDTKPRSGEEDIQYSTLAFKANNPPQPAPGPTHPLEGNIIYSEIRKK